MKYTGVTARGIKTPIFRQGDDLAAITVKCILEASADEGFTLSDGDIVGITESVVARTQGNYATCEQIAADVRAKLGGRDMGIVFPILSRNRFSLLLKAFSMACDKLYVQLSYPDDEVGNALISRETADAKGVDPYRDSFDEASFTAKFGPTVHPFTGVNYVDFYKSCGENVEVVFSNDPKYILKYTKNVLVCDIHSRERTKGIIKAAGAERIFKLDEILTVPLSGSGYNSRYGLLGSNKADEDKVKLFPEDAGIVVTEVRDALKRETGKNIEVLVYGDGCFKDPVGGIWELADPVVSPAYSDGLRGKPNELKIKYFADNDFASLSGDELTAAVKKAVKNKSADLTGNMSSQGTTPRRITDLLGSLCDLTSGSGDRGTPVVLIQNYFTNYASEE